MSTGGRAGATLGAVVVLALVLAGCGREQTLDVTRWTLAEAGGAPRAVILPAHVGSDHAPALAILEA